MQEEIKELQAKWDAENPLMLENLDQGIKDCFLDKDRECVYEPDLKEFLNILINSQFIAYKTLDSITEEVVCENNKHRSLHDIYLVTKYYIEHVNLKDIIFALLELNKEDRIRSLVCSNIKARTYYPAINERNYGDWGYEKVKKCKDYDEKNETYLNFQQLINYYEECTKSNCVVDTAPTTF